MAGYQAGPLSRILDRSQLGLKFEETLLFAPLPILRQNIEGDKDGALHSFYQCNQDL